MLQSDKKCVTQHEDAAKQRPMQQHQLQRARRTATSRIAHCCCAACIHDSPSHRSWCGQHPTALERAFPQHAGKHRTKRPWRSWWGQAAPRTRHPSGTSNRTRKARQPCSREQERKKGGLKAIASCSHSTIRLQHVPQCINAGNPATLCIPRDTHTHTHTHTHLSLIHI